jgi:uncharacterized protein (TIGR03083 family)
MAYRNSVVPIAAADLFPVLHAKLIELLRSLDAREWEMPTVAPGWTVKDVAAHLLDTQQRLVLRLSGEPQPPPPAIASDADLVAFINRLNADGVTRYRQLTPSALIAMMDEGAGEFAAHHRAVDPFAEAPFGVSWAGEARSANWFHTAREFTERWHHQQQIRLAVGKPGIVTRELYYPVLDCFMRALPFRYRDKARAAGTVAQFDVAGGSGGSWYLRRDDDGWRLVDAPEREAASTTTIPQEIAWLIFTKGMSRAAAERQVRVTGDANLGLHVLSLIAIVG